MDRTSPGGRVIGIDIIPTQPPKGVSTIQGNFLSIGVQDEVKKFLRDPDRGKPREQRFLTVEGAGQALTGEELEQGATDYIQLERREGLQFSIGSEGEATPGSIKGEQEGEREDRMVDIILSDMSAPWEQTTGFWNRSLSDPYYRMMNTSGMSFRDHAGSMVRDLAKYVNSY